MTTDQTPRRTRGQAVAEARYARRLHDAGDDSAAAFMAHVDRIRALKNALLICTAADLLAGLIDHYRVAASVSVATDREDAAA